MRPSLAGLVRALLAESSALVEEPILTVARILSHVQVGLFALVVVWTLLNALSVTWGRRSARCAPCARSKVWPRTTIVMILCSAILAAAEFVWCQVAGTRAIEAQMRIHSGDIAGIYFRGHMALAIGLITAAFGLASGWLLEWFASGGRIDGGRTEYSGPVRSGEEP
jgi:hypothetical protein